MAARTCPRPTPATPILALFIVLLAAGAAGAAAAAAVELASSTGTRASPVIPSMAAMAARLPVSSDTATHTAALSTLSFPAGPAGVAARKPAAQAPRPVAVVSPANRHAVATLSRTLSSPVPALPMPARFTVLSLAGVFLVPALLLVPHRSPSPRTRTTRRRPRAASLWLAPSVARSTRPLPSRRATRVPLRSTRATGLCPASPTRPVVTGFRPLSLATSSLSSASMLAVSMAMAGA